MSGSCKPVKKKPSDYFRKQIYCDSIVFTAEGLRHLVAEVGADHVLFGTDYPADIDEPHMGDAREVDSVLGVSSISDADKRAILGENARASWNQGLTSRMAHASPKIGSSTRLAGENVGKRGDDVGFVLG